jgi:hypothetical protein
MPSSTEAFSPRLLGNEKRMRLEIVKMKMISRAQMKITGGRKRMMGNYRSRRRNGRGVRISWFQGMMRGPTARMKRSMSWRRTLRMGKKRGTSHWYLMHRIICRRVTVTNYNIKR